jgi:hypothetical protein
VGTRATAGRDVKLAAVDVLSVFAGAVLGAGAMTQYARVQAGSARAHPAPAGLGHASTSIALGALCGLAVTAATHYGGLRLLREPLAGPSSAVLLTALPVALAAGTAAAGVIYGALGNSMAGAAAALTMAAVTALATPGVTRRLVRDFCQLA